MPTTRAYEQKRRNEKPWRKWYSTKEWHRLRTLAFKRDGITLGNGTVIPRCTKTGELLEGKSPAPNSPIADHIKPHRGDRQLFFDLRNIQTVSKRYHDSVKQSHERKPRPTIGKDGWPVTSQQ